MRWLGREGSGNVEDQRGSGGFGGGGFGFGGLGRIGGIGGLLLVLAVSCLTGRNPLELVGMGGGGGVAPQEQSAPTGAPAESDSAARFVSVVLRDTEVIWTKIFQESGKQYREPHLVLFRSEVQSGCGGASAASGPFYCPADQKVYIDLSFYDELRERFGAPGDFAMAYVIAHEVGHHVQNMLGTTEQVDRLRGQASEKEVNAASVKLELQADFYAGVWAHYADKSLNVVEAGDVNEALNAANAIGDDRLQMEAQGRVVPDAFTHGTSAQRQHWFKLGYQTGDPAQGNTFEAQSLSSMLPL